jgi:hypothetical protein
MYSSISLRVTLLEHPALGQVLVSISPISVPRWVRTTIFEPHPGLACPSYGNSPTSFMKPKRTTRVLGIWSFSYARRSASWALRSASNMGRGMIGMETPARTDRARPACAGSRRRGRWA